MISSLWGRIPAMGLKVLIVSHLYPNRVKPTFGGFVARQVSILRQQGVEVRVVSPTPYSNAFLSKLKPKWREYYQVPEEDKIDQVQVSYPRYPHLPGSSRRWLSGPLAKKFIGGFLRKIVSEFGPDCVLANMLTMDAYLATQSIESCPVFSYMIGDDINIYPSEDQRIKQQTSETLELSDKILSVSHSLAQQMAKIFGESLLTKTHIVYRGFDLNRLPKNRENRASLKDQLGLSGDHRYFLYLGGLEKNKGVLDLAQAAKSYPEKYQFLFIGDGELMETLSEISPLNTVSLGRKPFAEVQKYLMACDAFIFPSYNEGFSNALLEAQAHGLPALVSDIPPNCELIEDGVNGYRFTTRSVSSLKKAIDRFLALSQTEVDRLSTNSSQRVQEKFSTQKNIEKLIDLLR